MLYSIDPSDFALTEDPVWAEKIANGSTSAWPHPYVHAPFIAQFMSLVVKIASFDFSVYLLTVVSGWALVVTIAAAWYLWTSARIPWVPSVLASALGWCTVAFQSSIYLGQTSPLIFAGVAYSLAAAHRYPLRAGIILGIVSAVKLTPALLIAVALVFPSRRRAGWVALFTGIVLAAISLFVGGSSLFSDWLETIRIIGDTVQVAPVNISYASIVSSELVENSAAIVPIVNDPPVHAIWVPRAVAAILCILVVCAAWRSNKAWAVVAIGMLTITTAAGGILWEHYLLVAVLPLAGIWTSGKVIPQRLAIVTALLLVPPLGYSGSPLWIQWGGLIALVALVILMCWTCGAVAPKRTTDFPRNRWKAQRITRRCERWRNRECGHGCPPEHQ
ncbi:MAG TPA: DUF2029 domain-containing protein [Candidatus Corynebacterium gallistercoris]|uniref:DUF2029 domain-containing protein n=1 Tax=Candidatus Corynebacterium gallistercoris TaxID=2838530 RepID=A0A9D1UQL9_9CORY|nr:DUF2029 domain-containing protein [Candidatus Corynebacterium gallistercoris]